MYISFTHTNPRWPTDAITAKQTPKILKLVSQGISSLNLSGKERFVYAI